MNLTIEQKTVLNLLKNSLSNQEKSIEFNELNFADLFNIADKHSVNMLCFDALKDYTSNIPSEVYSKWLYFASRKMTLNENVISVQMKLTKLLETNQIKYFVFKGLSIASYYKNSSLRELGDIDFYVDELDFKKAHLLLKNNGFTLISTKGNMHFAYECNGVEIEMHKNFWEMPENECSVFLSNFLKESINNTNTNYVDEYSFEGPNCVANAVILLLHIINHIQKGGIGLRQFYDFAAYISSEDFANNIGEILDVFKKGGIYLIAQVVAKISHQYFETPYFEFFEDADKELCDSLLFDVLESGNFGGLSQEKYYGSTALTMGNLFEFCKMSWRPCEKHKILLPIAPFYIGVRYVCRALIGKRPKINPLKLSKTSYDRINLYKKLNFFEEN